ncbi:DUF4227 family protein [Effusibacillus dendaii]|uniref:DUF4227 family protein n=1 Tax=Effusibacillus dendaii TaxID=2743772 RepID=A0A7I8D6X5_9BACL|nr:DUF4227 family protein [Effusibacillus dendaii]BCJ85825.1 hypothetical protein skT53_08100 [Effusibacillus dendaii]
MIVSLRQIARWVQMAVLVCLFSFVLFKAMALFHAWIQPVDKYREPRGNSLKVNSVPISSESDSDWDWANYILSRMKMFYFTGE